MVADHATGRHSLRRRGAIERQPPRPPRRKISRGDTRGRRETRAVGWPRSFATRAASARRDSPRSSGVEKIAKIAKIAKARNTAR